MSNTTNINWSYSESSPLFDGILTQNDPENLLFNNGSPGDHILKVTASNGNCLTSDSMVLTILEPMVLTNVVEECNGLTYTVSFDIVGGIAPYTINGNLIAGNSFLSNPIATGNSYSFVSIDNEGCISNEIVGNKNCDCDSDAGLMPQQDIELCGLDQLVIVEVTAGSSTLDSDDIGLYFLHDSPTNQLGTVFQESPIGEMSFQPTMTSGQVYYISYAVGNDLSGSIDISDPCLDISIGTPVFWFDPLQEIYPGAVSQCGDTILLPLDQNIIPSNHAFRLIGAGMLTVDFIDSSEVQLIFDSQGDFEVEITRVNGACRYLDTIEVEIALPIDLQEYRDTILCGNELLLPSQIDGRSVTIVDTNSAISITNQGSFYSAQSDTLITTTLALTLPNSLCNESTQMEVTLIPELEINNLAYQCDENTQLATLSLDLVGGIGTYAINGQNLSSGSVIIYNLPLNEYFSFTVSSENCGSIEDSIFIDCGCVNAPASLPQDLLVICEGEMIMSDFVSSGQTGQNDTLLVLLHDGSGQQIGNILAESNLPTFTIDAGWPRLDTLWMTPVIGQLMNGTIDLLDSCIQVGISQPVLIIPETEINLFIDPDVCLGDDVIADIAIDNSIYPIIVEININGIAQLLTLENEDLQSFAFTAADSIITIDVIAVNTACPIQSLNTTLNIEDCSCITYEFESEYGHCNDGAPFDLSNLELGNKPASFELIDGDAAVNNEQLIIGDNFEGVIQLEATPLDEKACDSTYLIKILVELLPTVDFTQDLLTFCEADKEELDLNDQLMGTTGGQWNANTMINPDQLMIGENVFTYTIEAGAYCPEVQEEFTIQVFPTFDYIITSNNPDCIDQFGSIGITVDDEGMLQSTTLNDDLIDDLQIDDLVPGLFTITLLDSNNCVYSEVVKIDEPDPLEISLQAEEELTEGGNYILTSTTVGGNGDNIYTWIINGDTINITSPTISEGVDSISEIQVIVEDGSGCTAEDFIILIVVEEGNIPWTMPNIMRIDSDLNGVIRIPEFNDIEIVKQWSIYDRWGNKVFAAKDFRADDQAVFWDGQFNGQAVSSGVYLYFVEYTNRKGIGMIRNGDITVIR